MPNIEEILDSLSGAKNFLILDAKSGYFQVEVSKEDIHKTCFGCEFGTYEFLRMPFGLINGPSTFQRIVDNIYFKAKTINLSRFTLMTSLSTVKTMKIT